MNILLAGANGFIGSHLEKYLVKNGENLIKVSSPRKKEILSANTLDLEKIEDYVNSNKLHFDMVINAIQIYSREILPRNSPEMYQANVEIPKRLAIIADYCKSDFIHFSSYLESTDLQTEYVDHKKTISKWLDDRSGSMEIKRIILGDTFGNEDNRDKIMNILKSSCLSGTRLSLESPIRLIRLLFIEDLINNLFMLKSKGVYNFLHPKPLEIGSLCNLATKALHKPLEVDWRNFESNKIQDKALFDKISSESLQFDLILPEKIEAQVYNFFRARVNS